MIERTYLNFDVLIEPAQPTNYRARVFNSPAGETRPVPVTIPLSELELEQFLLRIGRPRRKVVRGVDAPEATAVREFGGRLFDAVFHDDLRSALTASRHQAESQDAGLRVRLHLIDSPELADLPWEYLYDGDARRFLALSEWTPLVRYIHFPGPIRPFPVHPPLRVLVMAASPTDFEPLDVDAEWHKVSEALDGLQRAGRVELDRLPSGTMGDLRRALREREHHVFHFFGHGRYDPDAQDGVLALEGPDGRAQLISGGHLGALLHDHRSLRLALLTSSEGARGGRTDPYSGTAQSLLHQGIPAVVAMQFEITDEAALAFTHGFYEAVTDGYPIDAAVTEGRKAIWLQPNPVEWGTPALYMRVPDAHVFGDLATADKPTAEDARTAQPADLAARGAPPAREEPVPLPEGTTSASEDLERNAPQGLSETPAMSPETSTAIQRFSSSALAALSLAEGLRRNLEMEQVHLEHLVLGLYEDPQGPLRTLLERAGLTRQELLSTLEKTVGPLPRSSVTPEPLSALPPLSEHAKEALDSAAESASARVSDMIGAEDVLSGVLSLAECRVVQALARRGISSDDIGGLTRPIRPSPARPRMLAGAAADTVPEPGEGRVRKADRLGTAAEVEMLVSVLLAKDTPLPLAVGLFGDWGSGKSFFMAQMEERMCELAQLAAAGRPEAVPFCPSVRPVRFNAWHYVDSDLWASLAATLFDQLARPDATSQAADTLAQLDQAQKKADAARERRIGLEGDVADLAARTARVASAVHPSLSVAVRAVRDDKDLLAHLQGVAQDDVSEQIPAERLVRTLGDINTVAEKARAVGRLLREEVFYRRRTVTLVTFGIFLCAAMAAWFLAGLPLGGKVLSLLGAAIAGLSPALAGALRILQLAREARESRELPLVEAREELDRALSEEDVAQREVEKRQQELSELRDKGLQLQKFVRDRAASSVYRRKLGTISQVRKDFEQLVTLMSPPGPEQVAAVAAEAVRQVPNVERIVLFIDDLDRCPHDKVVDVLQAVHLLLAFDLFIVVVGVDSRWLERSLKTHYTNLLEEPDRYLEKIFQIPFTLRRMSLSRYRDLIAELTPQPLTGDTVGEELGGHKVPQEEAARFDPSAIASDLAIGAAEQPDVVTRRELAIERTDETSVASSETEQFAHPPASTGAEQTGRSPGTEVEELATSIEDHVDSEPEMPRPEALVISKRERDLLGAVGRMIPTPRAAKRLVNIYRMLRVSVPDDELEAFQPQGGKEHEAVTVLLGILVGRPASAPAIFAAVLSTPEDRDVRDVLTQFPDVSRPLADVLEDISVTTSGVYRRWAPRVARFSFHLADRLQEGDTATAEKAANADGRQGDGGASGSQSPPHETTSPSSVRLPVTRPLSS